MTPTLETFRAAPVTREAPAPHEAPVLDPLREVADEITVDCRLLPDEYLDESLVSGGGE